MAVCTRCGAEVVAGGRFCGSCGVPVASSSVAAELGELDRLHAGGALDDDEFRAAKARVLTAPAPDRPAPSAAAPTPAGLDLVAVALAVAGVATLCQRVFVASRFESSFVEVSDYWWSRFLVVDALLAAVWVVAAIAVARAGRVPGWATIAVVPGLVFGATAASMLDGFESDLIAFGWWVQMVARVLALVAAAALLVRAWRYRRDVPAFTAPAAAAVAAVAFCGAVFVFIDRYANEGHAFGNLFEGSSSWGKIAAGGTLAALVIVPGLALWLRRPAAAMLVAGAAAAPLATGDGHVIISALSGNNDFRAGFAIVPALAVLAVATAILLARRRAVPVACASTV